MFLILSVSESDMEFRLSVHFRYQPAGPPAPSRLPFYLDALSSTDVDVVVPAPRVLLRCGAGPPAELAASGLGDVHAAIPRASSGGALLVGAVTLGVLGVCALAAMVAFVWGGVATSPVVAPTRRSKPKRS
jgi:hypothetical protein